MSMLPHWSEGWEQIAAHILDRPRLLIACDFDGTVSPIVPHPGDAFLSSQMHLLLRNLAACDGVSLAIISGRLLADVRNRAGIEGIFYCGNHGLEIEGPGIQWASDEAGRHRAELVHALAVLRLEIGDVEGVFIEDKYFTATVHWRTVAAQRMARIREATAEVIESHSGLRLSYGKAVWEIRPRVNWNKGSALNHLLLRLNLDPLDVVYLGDDETDESAFRVLRCAMTFRVGPANVSAARFRLNDVAEVASFLFCLLSARVSATRGAGHPHSLYS